MISANEQIKHLKLFKRTIFLVEWDLTNELKLCKCRYDNVKV